MQYSLLALAILPCSDRTGGQGVVGCLLGKLGILICAPSGREFNVARTTTVFVYRFSVSLSCVLLNFQLYD